MDFNKYFKVPKMIAGIMEYWRQKLGFDHDVNDAQNEQFIQRNYFVQQDMPNKHESVLQDFLDTGTQTFSTGQRTEAIVIFNRILDYPIQIPSYRLAAACLLGEIYRGCGHFEKAEHHYGLSINESANIPINQRILNGLYRHYRPRANLGLIMVHRRMLSPDHDKIKALIQETKDQFIGKATPDIEAQILLVEGLYLRQIGDIENSVNNLTEGISLIQELSPPYLFLHPEHFQALLILSFLCKSGYGIAASILANKILKSDFNPWSSAVASIALIHLNFRRLITNDNSNYKGWDHQIDIKTENERYLKILQEKAQFESDPFLVSEYCVLQMIHNMLSQDIPALSESLKQLEHVLKDASNQLIILRGTEVAAIRDDLLTSQGEIHDVIKSITDRAQTSLHKVKDRIQSYGYMEDQINQWSKILDSTLDERKYVLADWNDMDIRKMRHLSWP